MRPSPRQTTALATLACLIALPAAAMTGTPLEPETPVGLEVQFIEDVGGGARINMAGKLRMLSQRIPAAACNEAAGIAMDQSVPMLASAVAEYDRIIAALEFGDDGLGIFGAEENRKILSDIQALHAVWDPLHVDLGAMIAGDISHEHALHIEETSDDLLKRAQHMVSLISGRYADPAALMQADALTIDIAGRQRMLAQRMSKDACMIASGDHPEEALADMIDAIDMYETSLTALRFGMPAAGISPPPTEEISAGLEEIATDWARLKPVLVGIADNPDLDDATRADIFNGMNGLTGKMNTVVGLYDAASKQGL